MLAPNEAATVTRPIQEQLAQVLHGQDNWVENIDLVFRLMRLALATEDWESFKVLFEQTERLWTSVETLRASVGSLYHRGRQLTSPDGWVWLRNYLHERRLEAIASSLRPTSKAAFSRWLDEGLMLGTKRVGRRRIAEAARALAASDLRARDREDDRFVDNDDDTSDPTWMRRLLASDTALVDRLNSISEFVTRCNELGDKPWAIAPARLFLATRPPSYADVARRWLHNVEGTGFRKDSFSSLLDTVNALRGTHYEDPIGRYRDPRTVSFLGYQGDPENPRPRLILGNLVLPDKYWAGASKRVAGSTQGRPVLSWPRLRDLARLLGRASRVAARHGPDGRPPAALLVLPELAIPRAWLRTLITYVTRSAHIGVVTGVEYLHHTKDPCVWNQVYCVLPGRHSAVAVWAWTKRLPSREEAERLGQQHPPLSFAPQKSSRTYERTVVESPYGVFSVLICSELIEAHRVADLVGRVELVVVPSWNTDTFSYDHLIQSAGLELNCFIGIANNGLYSDCRVWAPRAKPFERDLCRLIERDLDDTVSVDLPLDELRAFRDAALRKGRSSRRAYTPLWRPLPPYWPPTPLESANG
jgi:hypothetical protein